MSSIIIFLLRCKEKVISIACDNHINELICFVSLFSSFSSFSLLSSPPSLSSLLLLLSPLFSSFSLLPVSVLFSFSVMKESDERTGAIDGKIGEWKNEYAFNHFRQLYRYFPSFPLLPPLFLLTFVLTTVTSTRHDAIGRNECVSFIFRLMKN